MRKNNPYPNKFHPSDDPKITPAHGWLATPIGRTQYAVTRGWIFTAPNGWPASEMEGMKNFPMYTNGTNSRDLIWFPGEGGPYLNDSTHIFYGVTSPLPDGVLFSGGQTANDRDIVNFTDSELMMRHGVMWPRTEVVAGQYLQINWHHTARHATRGYRYFITRDDWDPTRRATRHDFERMPFASVINMTAPLTTIDDQTIKLPSNKKGHHIILAIWLVQDTGAGFYSAFDVDFGEGGGGETEGGGGGTEGGGGGTEGGGGETEGGGGETEGGGGETEVNYPQWSPNGVQYNIGDRVIHNGQIFVCIQAHRSQVDRIPGNARSLWESVS